MAFELIYTSAPRGLRPGTSGYCTVAHTVGMAPPLIRTLEAISAYRPASGETGAQAAASFMHLRVPGPHGTYNILSRIAPAGLDHTWRPNKLAHHIVLEPHERAHAGPLWVLTRPQLFVEHWSGQPRLLQDPPTIPTGDELPGLDETPPGTSIDTRWAQKVAQTLSDASLSGFREGDSVPCSVIVPEAWDALTLAAEVISLLPPDRRWDVTFATRFVDPQPPAGLACSLRFIPAGSEAARAAARGRSLVIDLASPTQPPPARPHDGNEQRV